MREDRRITRLAGQLLDDWQRGRTPRSRISHDDASAIARGLHREMDERTRVRAGFARERSLAIACAPGCSHCCENLVMVFKGESVAVAQWLREPENRAAREWFHMAYPRWREAIGDAPERARDAQITGSDHRYRSAALDVWRDRVMCAFNRDGQCTVYPVRPNTCRNCHALDTNEHCLATSQTPPRTIDSPDIEEFRTNVKPLSEAAHVALGGQPGLLSALCQEVHELLDSGAVTAHTRSTRANAKVGRNQPCPCGSGRKFKRCCG